MNLSVSGYLANFTICASLYYGVRIRIHAFLIASSNILKYPLPFQILDLEQELKKAAGEDKKPRPPADSGPVPAEALADEELVKELAAHDEAIKEDTPEHSKEDDSTEVELEQEKEVAEKAAELKAKQEEKHEEEALKDVEKAGLLLLSHFNNVTSRHLTVATTL